jgi:hypothetical protein
MASAPPSPVAFLLGAGASADARIPVMREMHRAFIDRQNPEDQEFLRRVETATLPYAARLGRDGVDTELLLAGLEHIAALPDDLSRHLLGANSPPAAALVQASRLARTLRTHIREQCLIPTERDVEYLQPLIRLTNTYDTLDFFSVNYDLCIEMAAAAVEVPCETGFELYWNPERLDRVGTSEQALLRLHKLHGSVTWFQSEYQYLHLPVRPVNGVLERVDGTRLDEMLVYPALDKEPDLSPYPNLIDRLRQTLRTAKVLVVIGYAFGDKSLQYLLTEALKQNRRLQLLIVEPGETRAGEFFEADRFVHLKSGLRAALADEQLLTTMNRLIEADLLAAEGFRAVGIDSRLARTRLTEAIDSYLSTQHWAGAQHLVMRAVKAIITPPRTADELLIRDWRTLIEHAPSFDAPTALAWFGLLPYHLDGIESVIIEQQDLRFDPDELDELGAEKRLIRRAFRPDAFSWEPDLELGDLRWWENQMLLYAQGFPEDQSMRKHALRRLAAQLARLDAIYDALVEYPESREALLARIRPPIEEYRQEQGISVLGQYVATALTESG